MNGTNKQFNYYLMHLVNKSQALNYDLSLHDLHEEWYCLVAP